MRQILAAAASMRWRECSSELAALEAELDTIQALRPKFNVSGAFYFMYPFMGWRQAGSSCEICFTTCADQPRGFSLFGAFRSRHGALAAFEALTELLEYLGHRQRRKAADRIGDQSYSVYALYRQLPETVVAGIPRFLHGDETWLPELARELLERPSARRDACLIQDRLQCLSEFFECDLRPLVHRMKELGLSYPISQTDVDRVRIRVAELPGGTR